MRVTAALLKSLAQSDLRSAGAAAGVQKEPSGWILVTVSMMTVCLFGLAAAFVGLLEGFSSGIFFSVYGLTCLLTLLVLFPEGLLLPDVDRFLSIVVLQRQRARLLALYTPLVGAALFVCLTLPTLLLGRKAGMTPLALAGICVTCLLLCLFLVYLFTILSQFLSRRWGSTSNLLLGLLLILLALTLLQSIRSEGSLPDALPVGSLFARIAAFLTGSRTPETAISLVSVLLGVFGMAGVHYLYHLRSGTAQRGSSPSRPSLGSRMLQRIYRPAGPLHRGVFPALMLLCVFRTRRLAIGVMSLGFVLYLSRPDRGNLLFSATADACILSCAWALMIALRPTPTTGDLRIALGYPLKRAVRAALFLPAMATTGSIWLFWMAAALRDGGWDATAAWVILAFIPIQSLLCSVLITLIRPALPFSIPVSHSGAFSALISYGCMAILLAFLTGQELTAFGFSLGRILAIHGVATLLLLPLTLRLAERRLRYLD